MYFFNLEKNKKFINNSTKAGHLMKAAILN